MFFIFYNTNDVFAAEEKLQNAGICVEIVPTPVQDKAYCGVCVKVSVDNSAQTKLILKDMEYKTV